MVKMKKNNKTGWISVRVPEEVEQAIEKEAQELHLTVSAYLRLVLCEFFKAKGGE